MRTKDAPPVVEGVQSSLETALRVLASSELCKADVLINSLSVDLWELGSNLREHYGAQLCSSHVSAKLTELHEIRESRMKVEAAEAAEAVEAVEDCTWCRSKKIPSAGHGWRDCRRLRRFQNRKQSNAPGRRA